MGREPGNSVLYGFEEYLLCLWPIFTYEFKRVLEDE